MSRLATPRSLWLLLQVLLQRLYHAWIRNEFLGSTLQFGVPCNCDSKTAEAYHWTYRAVFNALYLKYRLLKPQACKFDECLGCLAWSLQLEHDKGYFHIFHNNLKDLAIKHFPLEKPSSESSGAFIKIVKQEFGQGVPIEQCCVHFTGTASSNLLQNILA